MWILNVDGFAREKHKGTGFILEDSNGHQYAYALLANLHTTRSFEITHILVKSDSQVVIGQVTGEFDAKEDSIEKYLECVQHLSSKFSQIMFENVPQKEICMLTCCLSSVLESLWKVLGQNPCKKKAFPNKFVLWKSVKTGLSPLKNSFSEKSSQKMNKRQGKFAQLQLDMCSLMISYIEQWVVGDC